MHKSLEMKAGISRSSSSLRPPPLFRSIGPPGLSASLPPHRRLRSLFCRSRVVLPANTHPIEASDTRVFSDIQTGNHAGIIMSPLGCNDMFSEDIQPEVDSDLHSRAVFRSRFFANTGSIVSTSSQAQCGQKDRQLFSHLCPSAQPSGRNKGRQDRMVTPLQTSEDPVMKEKQQQKRRKRNHKVDSAGQQKYVVPSLTEKEEDARLCEWLQSLGMADSHEKDSATKTNQQQLFASRCRGVVPGHPEQETAASHRRDRRPYFLPPICQSDSLLHVPLLLPENSPPPSPCSYPATPIHLLPVPLLQLFSPRRK